MRAKFENFSKMMNTIIGYFSRILLRQMVDALIEALVSKSIWKQAFGQSMAVFATLMKQLR